MAKFCKKCGCVVDDESRDYCFACLEENAKNTPKFPAISQQKDENPNGDRLSITLIVIAWMELIVCVVTSFMSLWDFGPIIFFGCLIGGIIGFVIFHALSVFVKAANKYLNS